MKCIILAAGYATRLYPLTKDFPKPLLKVGEKTIIDWLVDDIAKAGIIDEFIVVTNHRFAHFFEEWADSKTVNVSVVDDGTENNETRLGAVADIRYAIEKLSIKDDVLVLAGDNVLDFSLNRFVEYAVRKNASCVMRHFEPEVSKLRKTGVLTIDDNDKVLKMAEKPEKPESNWACPPFYFYKHEDILRLEEAMENGCGTDAPGSFVAWLCEKTDVYAYEMPGTRHDIGDMASYEAVQKTYKGIINQ